MVEAERTFLKRAEAVELELGCEVRLPERDRDRGRGMVDRILGISGLGMRVL